MSDVAAAILVLAAVQAAGIVAAFVSQLRNEKLTEEIASGMRKSSEAAGRIATVREWESTTQMTGRKS